MKTYLFLISLLVLSGCTHNADKESSVEITRFDIIATDSTVAQSEQKLMPALCAMRVIHGDTALNPGQILALYKESQATKAFSPDVRKLLPELKEQEKELGASFKNILQNLPNSVTPTHIYGYVTPYMQSIVLVDSVMFVGLNHYLGENYLGYDGFEHYKRKLKQPNRIAIDAIEAIIYTNYPYHETDNPVALSRMLYEGAIVSVLQDVMPEHSVADLLGYSDDEWKWSEEHERDLWKSMAENGILYSHDPMMTTRIISPAPNSAVALTEAPGRIGRYIGYKIVQSYLNNHKDMSIKDILSPEFYNSQSTLIDAEYSPK